jgi:hypothetical protein
MPPQHELFAVYVASGLSYRAAARSAGFHEDNGFRLMQLASVQTRVEELVRAPSERVRAGIDAEFLMLRNRAANEDLDAEGRANVELRLKLLMAHARYQGWIVQKKQVASVSLGRLSRADLSAHLGRLLEELEPGARAEIQRRADALDLTPLALPPGE